MVRGQTLGDQPAEMLRPADDLGAVPLNGERESHA